MSSKFHMVRSRIIVFFLATFVLVYPSVTFFVTFEAMTTSAPITPETVTVIRTSGSSLTPPERFTSISAATCKMKYNQWIVTPVGNDHYSSYPGFGSVLSHGFDPNCFPSDYERGKIYSASECPEQYHTVHTEVNPYSAGLAADYTRMITTVTCCVQRQNEIIRLNPTGPLLCFQNGSGFGGAYVKLLESGTTVATDVQAKAFIDDYVEIAFEGPKIASSTPFSSGAVNQTSQATPSQTATMPNPTTNLLPETGNAQPGLSTGTKAGIAAGSILFAITVVVLCLFLWRRRARKQETSRSPSQDLYTKPELPGDGVPHTELDETTGLQEAGGLCKLPEADGANIRAELESDWTGWEAPALLEVELSRNALDLAPVADDEARRRSEFRNSIQETPVDMVARQ